MHADSGPVDLDVFTQSHDDYAIRCNKAARIIQGVWRRHVDSRVFTYFKRLIQFHNQGDPRVLLRHVNPREADMLDSAAGVFIRFRLGGVKFPPSIYYKIFTHRPIVDMCANSPKDYTNEATRQPVPRQVHLLHSAVCHDDRSGWYKRVDNNGWRVLAGKVGVYPDEVTVDTASKRVEHRHTKLLRRQDVAKRRKLRKIEWFKKMYEEGALCARTEDTETAVLVEKSTFGMLFAVDQLGVDNIADWEVDELLEWTNSLNFDEYISEWKTVGTSQSSVQKERRAEPSGIITSDYSKLTQNDSQYVTNSSTLYPQMSNQIKSEHSLDPAPLNIDGSILI
ncbi:protein MFI [Engraulis encrasicolus]|uniref:protein MFI n=1 Tax=Engraulis encrasicolus TaxID=184585 RepID=UPI002FD30400